VTLLLIANAHHECVKFRMPQSAGGQGWLQLLNTDQPDADEVGNKESRRKFGETHEVTGRSLLLFKLVQPQRRASGV
jgi:isoamylase